MATTQTGLGVAIIVKLLASGQLATNVTNRFYDTIAPTDANGDILAKLPLIIYQAITSEIPPNLSKSDFRSLVQFDLWSSKALGVEAAQANNDLLFTALDRQAFTMNNHTGVEARCEDRGAVSLEADAIRITSQYTFFGTT